MRGNISNNLLVTQSEIANDLTAPEKDYPLDTGWGVDYISFSFPVDVAQSSLIDPMWTWEGIGKFHDSNKESTTHKAIVTFGHAVSTVTFKPEYGVAYVSFNPSRVLVSSPNYLLPPNALSSIVEAFIDQIQGALHPAFDEVNADTGVISRRVDWIDFVAIHRLDLARDFLIDDLATVKAHLVQAQPKYGKVNHLYWGTDGGWTLQNSTKKVGHDRIYDKYAELGGHKAQEEIGVTEGTFRFEVQLHKDRLKKFGLKKLSSVNDQTTWRALETRWNASNWDVCVPEPNTLLTAVDGLTAAKKEGLIGYLYLAGEGVANHMPKDHVRERNRQAAALGLQPGLSLSAQGKPSRKLDLHAGRLVKYSETSKSALEVA